MGTKPLPALDLSPVVPVLDARRLEREAEAEDLSDEDGDRLREAGGAGTTGLGLEVDADEELGFSPAGPSYTDAREWRRAARSFNSEQVIRVETSSLPPSKRARMTETAGAAEMGVSRAEAAMIFKATRASLGEGLRRVRTKRLVEDAKRRILGSAEKKKGVGKKGKGKTESHRKVAEKKMDIKGKGRVREEDVEMEVEVKEETPVPASTGVSTRRSTRLNPSVEVETPPPRMFPSFTLRLDGRTETLLS